MENKLFKKDEKILINVGGAWQKGKVVETETDGTLLVNTDKHSGIKVASNSSYIEKLQHPAQKFAYAEAQERLKDAFIKFETLPKRVQDSLVKGKEYIHNASYVHEGELKESVRAIQLVYDPYSGSKLDVQIKRNEPVKLDDAKAYNHQFTKKEFDLMKKEGKAIVFQGNTSDGEVFEKLAYYEPRLNDIRTKPALSDKNYVYKNILTKEQADSLNKGEEVKMVIETNTKGKKVYLVSFDPRNGKFITKSLDNLKKKEANESNKVSEQKKKNRSNGITR